MHVPQEDLDIECTSCCSNDGDYTSDVNLRRDCCNLRRDCCNHETYLCRVLFVISAGFLVNITHVALVESFETPEAAKISVCLFRIHSYLRPCNRS